MFTGIVQAIGRITQQLPLGKTADHGLRLTIDAGLLSLTNVKCGDSIAVQGICLTVVELAPPLFWVEVSVETLRLTTGLTTNLETGSATGLQAVNLEKALCVGDALGGHLVSGHIDGTATVVTIKASGESLCLILRLPQLLAPYVSIKGSATIDGVSLTINTVQDHPQGCDIAFNLIPHTLTSTTLNKLVPGSLVNIEVDRLARYCERILHYQKKV